jgi:hypothetical protein
MRRALALAALAWLVAACTSPEATRTRAGGPGGDVGNRRDNVSMHEGSKPYWSTPRTPGITGPPEPATRAGGLIPR